MINARNSWRLGSSIAFVLMCLLVEGHTSAQTITLFATNVPEVAGSWDDEVLAEGSPGCPDPCPCNDSDYAFNDVAGDAMFLVATNLQNISIPMGHVITGVSIDVMARYDDDTTGRIRMRLLVPSLGLDLGPFESDEFTSSLNCRWRMHELGDVTNVLGTPWTQSLINDMQLKVRRLENPTTLRVKAFRIQVTYAPSCGNGVCDPEESYSSCPGDCPPLCPSEGSCCVVHGTPGCDNAACCDTICDIWPQCCSNEWQSLCVWLATTHCEPLCGTVCGNGLCAPGETPASCPGDCPPPADWIAPFFVGGALLINGQAVDSDGQSDSSFEVENLNPNSYSADASGQTGSGLVDAFGFFLAQFNLGQDVTVLSLSGCIAAQQPPGYGGSAFLEVTSKAPLEFTLNELVHFQIKDLCGNVSLDAVTGAISGDMLLPGTYAIEFSMSASVSGKATLDSERLSWHLTLTRGADLNGDDAVDSADLANLLSAWGPCPSLPACCTLPSGINDCSILSCTSLTPCPSDFNANGEVDAGDLANLLANWG